MSSTLLLGRHSASGAADDNLHPGFAYRFAVLPESFEWNVLALAHHDRHNHNVRIMGNYNCWMFVLCSFTNDLPSYSSLPLARACCESPRTKARP